MGYLHSPTMRRTLLALAVTWLAALPACDDPHLRFITDDQGRALILHGSNLSSFSKSDPNRLPSWLTRDDALRLSRDWNFNFVRFLILWDALEPQPGQIDAAYLDAVEGYLDWLHEAGVRVVLDMHQDVYSRVFCCDGAPPWAVRDDGQPFQQQPVWFANYFQPAVIRSWDNFWAAAGPHADLQQHFAAAWAAVAARLGSHPAVLGYDVLNEPYPGTPFDILNLPSGPMPAFERDLYAPFYQRVIAAIRAQDVDGWIFFEPTYGMPAAGRASFLPRLADPRPGEPRLAYFPHLYSITLEGGGGYQPAIDKTVADWEVRRREDLQRHETPMLIGEFGVTDGVGDGLIFLGEVLDMADRMTSGWTVWDYEPSSGGYSFIDSQKNEKTAKADVLVRVYPRAVSGEPISYRYYPGERLFLLLFKERAGTSGPTEISVPASRHYPGGFDVFCSDPAGTWSSSWDATREILSIETDPASPRHLVRIQPKGYVAPGP